MAITSEESIGEQVSNQSSVDQEDSSSSGGESTGAATAGPVGRSEFSIRYSRNKNIPRLLPIGTELLSKPDENKFDAMVYLIHCTKHNNLAVYEDAKAQVKWLPFTPLFPDK